MKTVLVFKKNPDYFNKGLPYLDGITFEVGQDPSVALLRLENGEVDIAGDGVPDVLFTSYSGSSYSSPGTLTAISGDGTGAHWSITEAAGYRVQGAGGVALGDLDAERVISAFAATRIRRISWASISVT